MWAALSPPSSIGFDVFQLRSAPGAQVYARVFDTAQEARVDLKAIIELPLPSRNALGLTPVMRLKNRVK